MIALYLVYIFEEKIYIQSYFIVLLLQLLQFALFAVLQKVYMRQCANCNNCKVQKGSFIAVSHIHLALPS